VIKPGGLAVGIDEGNVFDRVTKDFSFQIESGDCLLLHTDGVKEALNNEDQEYGLERMKATFLQSSPMGAEAVLAREFASAAVSPSVCSMSGDASSRPAQSSTNQPSASRRRS
jgi:hypothetical protein